MNKIVNISRLKTEKGFILADVSLAIVIVSVALLAISSMFSQGIQADVVAKDYTVVTNLAQNQLELLKTQSPEYWYGLTLPCVIPWQDSTTVLLPKYTLITYADSYVPDHHLVQVTVNASWKERGTDYNLNFVTLYPTL